MDAKLKAGIVLIAVVLIIVGIIGFSIYLLRLSQNKTTVSGGLNSLLKTTIVTPGANPPTGGPAQSAVLPTPTIKAFIGSGYVIKYPINWGVLICNNSNNIELDPNNSTDFRNVKCDRAQKPVTILVSQQALNCPGDNVSLGANQVKRSVTKSGSDIDYRWCLKVGSTNLDITHRVSPSGSTATSSQDYSIKIEEMIKAIQSPPTGS